MKKTIILTTALFATIGLSACTSNSTKMTDSSRNDKTEISSVKKESAKATAGEIIGSFNSDDGKVVGATKPGESVTFKIPKSKEALYLHFAFMHAASGDKGWYFAPKSEDGIKVSENDLKDNKELDITDEISLFAAPDAKNVSSVTKDDGNLKYAQTSKFMKATIKSSNGKYIVTINNISKGDYETPFSSGVFSTIPSKEKSFDHQPSEALSILATSGHRDELYNSLK